MGGLRIDWIDRMKGILILLVVLGHSVGMAIHYTSGGYHDVLEGIFKLIYLFHMPAFFFLAGLTFKSKDFGQFMRNKFFRLLLPYFCFGVISVAAYHLLIGYFEPSSQDGYYAYRSSVGAWWAPIISLFYGAPFPGTDGFRCNSVLWFMPCLFTSSLFLLMIIKLGMTAEVIVSAVAIPSYILLNRVHCPSLPLGLLSVMRYLPFMILGHLMSRFLLVLRPSLGLRIFLFLCLLFYLIFAHFAPFGETMTGDYAQWPFVMLFGFLGSLGAVFVAMRVEVRGLSFIGGCSIGIMMLHKWFILVVSKFVCKSPIVCFTVAVCLSVLCVVMIRKTIPFVLGEGRFGK